MGYRSLFIETTGIAKASKLAAALPKSVRCMASSFQYAFASLADHQPFRWQERLYDRFIVGDIPRFCDLPTGLGKTSVLTIWLIARAQNPALPRRLVYVVNRRTVVDQATTEVEKLRCRLQDPQLAPLAKALGVGRETPLPVSTLRGELADNGEWRADPARSAIIVGTVDMIGSKLLFSGYGDGRYLRPHHSGLIGQDTLVVHDEAHLTPAFSELLHSIVREQRKAAEPRPLRVMELSATTPASREEVVFGLEPEDDLGTVRQRLDAKKNLRICSVAKTDLEGKLVGLASEHESQPSKVLIYVRSPEMAQAIVKRLGKDGAGARVALLTGTIRGHERDRLARQDPVYQALLRHEQPVDETVYLVSTSAGEVGIDLDADHMVCDLTTLDAMIQRLGRVNRRGGSDRVACVHVVEEEGEARRAKPSEVDLAIQATPDLLARLPAHPDGSHDPSPRALRDLLGGLVEHERRAAFAPKPEVQSLSDILLDAWSLTSIDEMPGRPVVAPYLHGLTNEPPETHVVWRKEVTLLDEARADDDTLTRWFRACPIETRERLRARTEVVEKTLMALLAKHRKDGRAGDFPALLLDERGRARRVRLAGIADHHLAYRTVVLPVEVGGLTYAGTLDGTAVEPVADVDVADISEKEDETRRRERWVFDQAGDGEPWRRLLTGEARSSPPLDLREVRRIALDAASEEGDTGVRRQLVLMASPRRSALESPELARTRQTLGQHTRCIEGHAKRMAAALGLEDELADALVMAARWHDRGKARPIWQRYASNADQVEPLAKSEKYLHWRVLGGYRHEFGSLLDACRDPSLEGPAERELILHLIAAHHGHARPHFAEQAYDRSSSLCANEEAAHEAMRRFGRLQRRFGWWGLAWLESLLRAADAMASQTASETIIDRAAE